MSGQPEPRRAKRPRKCDPMGKVPSHIWPREHPSRTTFTNARSKLEVQQDKETNHHEGQSGNVPPQLVRHSPVLAFEEVESPNHKIRNSLVGTRRRFPSYFCHHQNPSRRNRLAAVFAATTHGICPCKWTVAPVETQPRLNPSRCPSCLQSQTTKLDRTRRRPRQSLSNTHPCTSRTPPRETQERGPAMRPTCPGTRVS